MKISPVGDRWRW